MTFKVYHCPAEGEAGHHQSRLLPIGSFSLVTPTRPLEQPSSTPSRKRAMMLPVVCRDRTSEARPLELLLQLLVPGLVQEVLHPAEMFGGSLLAGRLISMYKGSPSQGDKYKHTPSLHLPSLCPGVQRALLAPLLLGLQVPPVDVVRLYNHGYAALDRDAQLGQQVHLAGVVGHQTDRLDAKLLM